MAIAKLPKEGPPPRSEPTWSMRRRGRPSPIHPGICPSTPGSGAAHGGVTIFHHNVGLGATSCSYHGRGCGGGRGRGGWQSIFHGQNKSKDSPNEDEKKQNTNLFQRGRGRGTYKRGKRGYIECFHCHKPGHKISECWYKQVETKNEVGLVHEDKIENSHETLLIACDGNVDNTWYLDSGASKHMTGNKNLFSNLVEANYGQVIIGDARSYKIQGVGDIAFRTRSGRIEKMTPVYYISGLESNLLSVGQLMKKGFDIHFYENICIMKKRDQLVAKINLSSNNLYPLKLEVLNGTCFLTANEEKSKLWHDRFGHLNFGSLKMMSSKNIVEGLPKIVAISEVCEDCQRGKQHREPFTIKLGDSFSFGIGPYRFMWPYSSAISWSSVQKKKERRGDPWELE